MILHDVADRASLLVELATPLDAKALGHRDLDVLHVAPVPDRLEERVGEAEDEDVVDRLLAEVVVDAEDRRLREYRVQDAVQLLRRSEIAAERLLDDHTCLIGAARLRQLLA